MFSLKRIIIWVVIIAIIVGAVLLLSSYFSEGITGGIIDSGSITGSAVGE